MGRIKTTLIKRNVKELVVRYPDRLSEDFNDNKKMVTDTTEVNSKKFRNVMAGYLTRIKRQRKE